MRRDGIPRLVCVCRLRRQRSHESDSRHFCAAAVLKPRHRHHVVYKLRSFSPATSLSVALCIVQFGVSLFSFFSREKYKTKILSHLISTKGILKISTRHLRTVESRITAAPVLPSWSGLFQSYISLHIVFFSSFLVRTAAQPLHLSTRRMIFFPSKVDSLFFCSSANPRLGLR